MSFKTITVLGSTGSIGVSTLDVIRRHPEQYQVFALTAHSRMEELFQQVQQFNPRYAVMGDEQQAQTLRNRLQIGRAHV